LLGALFHNGGIAILLSALAALFQMTYAGFFVNLNSIPPVLRWLQWINPLKYTLEALAVNEVGSGLQIVDTLEGVPVNVSAVLIMKMVSYILAPIVGASSRISFYSYSGSESIIIIGMFWSCLRLLLGLVSQSLQLFGSKFGSVADIFLYLKGPLLL
jgi:hypothetical protein